ncbi:integrase arm-type DNA-binding domain-containing protein [Stenotrophomonas sp. PS02289]|uniref:tyrosine-type recombinase/integrase n=1 Tax=Stenotrophomonas sp. PS02289 TaxID=2991422 RepID=UPI00249BD69C|nr:integrase arm-type DNA-binding domain-containing protein [Stenotrophomonas sp. PS02289]
MPLTDTAIRRTKPSATVQKLRDGGGLYLLLRPDGGRWWRWDYRRPVTGKRNTLSLGTYPDVSLVTARERHAAARRLLAEGIDPGAQRKAQKLAALELVSNTFEAVANEHFALRAKKLSAGSAKRERRLIEKDLAPWIGHLPIASITAKDVLEALRKIESRGAVETAHRARLLASQVFRYAIASGRAERNPADDVKGALSAPNARHFASMIEPAQIAGLLRALHGYQGSPEVVAALQLAPLVFVRPGELRAARWADIDLGTAEWRFSASKTGQPHVVPLARQSVAVLRGLHPLTGRGEFVFPGVRGRGRPMSENTVNAALRRLGYDSDTMTGHGFRAMARTVLDEVLGFRPDYIEHQLAHAVRDPNGRAYNRTAHLVERAKMMQAWADYLDGLRTSS